MNAEFPNDARDLMERLDRVLPPHKHTTGDTGGDPLLNAAQRLAQGPDVMLSDAALDRIEARLRQRTAELSRPAQVKLRPAARPAPWTARRTLWRTFRYVAAACFVLVMALVPLARTSASSLPGDSLYPTKRIIEDIRLALVSKSSEPGLRVDLADRRLDEFQTLLDKQNVVYPLALAEASDQLTRAVDLLALGYGSPTKIAPHIAMLSHEEAALILRAVDSASYEQWKCLRAVASRNTVLQLRLVAEVKVPDFVLDITPTPIFTPTPETPVPTATYSVTPTSSPTMTLTATLTGTPTWTSTPSPTGTMTGTVTLTQTPTPTGTLTGTVVLTPVPDHPGTIQPTLDESSYAPTRTPPGHGATPGLGDNPPGQGGTNPGVGNGGDPPGQGGDKPGGGKGDDKPGGGKK